MSTCKEISGSISAKGRNFAIILSRFNSLVTEQLLKGCLDALCRHEGEQQRITVIRVPGAFELPLAALKTARNEKYDAVIALGAIIRGETPHFDYVCAESAKGIGQVALKAEKPVIYGIVTTEDVEQALNRAGLKSGNKGWDAAMAAMEMVSVMEQIA